MWEVVVYRLLVFIQLTAYVMFSSVESVMMNARMREETDLLSTCIRRS